MTESAKLRDLRRAVKEGQEVIAVHYACESLSEAKDHPPAVACIGIANLKNGTRQAFSLADMPLDTEVKQREIGLLDRFYAHLAEHERSVVLHWNMNSSTYGFDALRNRYRYLTSNDLGQRPSEHLLYDLDDIIGDEYGENYVRHPKLYNLAMVNEIGLFSFLQGKEEAARFKSGDFGAIAGSATTKARAILDIMLALLSGRLKTEQSAGATRFAGQRIDAVEAVLSLGDRLRYVERELGHRHDKRPTLAISDEYDVQDLLRAVLLIFFEDVRAESWTPSYAGGASRIDFLVPAFELAIEVKKARASMTAKSLADELIVDRDRYKEEQRATHLICLVFDYDGILAGPRGLEADLARESSVEGLAVKVRIFDR